MKRNMILLHQSILDNARNADKIVKEKFENNVRAIDILSKDEVRTLHPRTRADVFIFSIQCFSFANEKNSSDLSFVECPALLPVKSHVQDFNNKF